jgi:hypothetical protein
MLRLTGFGLNGLQAMSSSTESFGNTFRNIGKRDIESLWHALKDAIQNTIDKRVPSKMTQGRHTSFIQYFRFALVITLQEPHFVFQWSNSSPFLTLALDK